MFNNCNNLSKLYLISFILITFIVFIECDGYCNYELIGRTSAHLSASSQVSADKAPKYAVLHEGSVWTASQNDFSQYLQIDLGKQYNISAIGTQGRQHTQEFVQEFKLETGIDGHDFSVYRDRNGNIKVNTGPSCWTAERGDFLQHLTIDLGNIYNLTALSTQGRANTNEYVSSFYLLISDGGDFWRMAYSDSEGYEQLFKGNSDGNNVVINRFDPPIIAQYIRINPTRWRDRISMRIQLYGCDYHAIPLHFDGQSLILMDLKKRPIESSFDDVFRFRFRTNSANGNIMYSRGTQGDFMALQLVNNKLVLSLDLGGGGLIESISAGSLLDDNLWHDVLISRRGRDVLLSVDRVLVRHFLKSDYTRLNLNHDMFIGGIPIKISDPINSRENFSGCIENLTFNSTNIAYEIQMDDRNFVYGKLGQIQYSCLFPQVVPLTFNTGESYIKVEGFMVQSMNTSFDFRTFNEDGLLLYHKFSSNGFVMLFLEKGKILIRFQGTNTPVVQLEPFDQTLNDGLWHSTVLVLERNRIILSMDGIPSITVRTFDMMTGQTYHIGGGFHGMTGFIGCMRWIYIEGRYVNAETLPPERVFKVQENDITIKSCQMIDRCHPNPCEHGGVCKQDNLDFYCDCALTGYLGAVCHVARHPLSCTAYKIDNPKSRKADVQLDVDGSGPLEPFWVTCLFPTEDQSQTIIHHRNELPTEVRGYHSPGSYIQDIKYDAPFEQIIEIVNRSNTCQQKLKYECLNARLLNTPVSPGADLQPFSWWVSRNNQKMDYWGGSLPGSRKCLCGLYGTCKDPRKWCNCDSASELLSQNDFYVDEGDITQREYLPVRQLRFGDTGSSAQSRRMGRYTLGPLICEGDALFEDIVTFRYEDATIELSPFDLGQAADIYLQFKTTAEFGVLYHNRGPEDFIKLSIVNGKTLQFSYSAGNGLQQVSVEASYRLNDNNWHSVLVEKNKKEARLVVDGQLTNEQRITAGLVRPLHLTSHFVIGATTEYREGYVGCLRSLIINGRSIEIGRYALEGLYGITKGCVGKCESNPCLNNGTCIDHYNGYTCDCQWTAFKGPICADEIGVNLRSDHFIRYDFETSISTLEEYIRVGFTTTEHRGLILGISSYSDEYLNLLMSNSGHLRLVFDFGFERHEIIVKEENFALGQHHDITIRRSNRGSKITIWVDNYEPKIYTFRVSGKADAQFNRLKSIYIGRNETMDTGDGFIGCISRVTFDDHFPLRRLYQENRRGNIHSFPINAEIYEDTCGIEPATHPPEIPETRPPPTLAPGETMPYIPSSASTGAIIGGVIAAIIVIILLSLFASGRFVSRQKGDYVTHEDKGAEHALDPDTAVVKGTTGPDVTKKKEYFI